MEFNGEYIHDSILAGNITPVKSLLRLTKQKSVPLYEMFKETHYIEFPTISFMDRINKIIQICNQVLEETKK